VYNRLLLVATFGPKLEDQKLESFVQEQKDESNLVDWNTKMVDKKDREKEEEA